MRVLIVEDERKMASFLEKGLKEHGLLPEVSHEGDVALERILESGFDAVVLDIMLPGLDGLSVVRRMRQRGNATPVLMLSARGQVDERIEGLEAGADDYMAKPFAIKEVAARVKALHRRGGESRAQILKIADFELDLVKHEAKRAGTALELSARELRMVEVLLRNARRVCGRIYLLEQVWEYNFDPGSNLVDVYMMRLRQKIDHGHDLKLLHTVRGAGYMLSDARP